LCSIKYKFFYLPLFAYTRTVSPAQMLSLCIKLNPRVLGWEKHEANRAEAFCGAFSDTVVVRPLAWFEYETFMYRRCGRREACGMILRFCHICGRTMRREIGFDARACELEQLNLTSTKSPRQTRTLDGETQGRRGLW
jgi:hypothetical protein